MLHLVDHQCVLTTDIMLKTLKENSIPITVVGLFMLLWLFPIWSHFNQDKQIKSIQVNGNETLVGASGFFAQNASVQLNFEAFGAYASVAGNFAFQGEIMPDGATCSNDQILKKTGANDWDCATDAGGSVTSNSLNFDEFQNPLVLDTNITTTSGSFTWNLGGTDLLTIGGASFSDNINWLGELKPDGVLCSNGQILKKTGANDWDCAADSTGGIASNSANFDEFQNPLVLDTNITTTSGSFNWGLGATSLVNIGSSSFAKYIDLGVAGVRLNHDGDGAITFLGLGNGTDEDLTINLDDTSNEIDFTTSTGVSRLDFNPFIGEWCSLQIDTVTTGVSLDTDGDGMLIIAGTGNGFDEDLRLNLDDTTNTGVFTSATALDTLNF